MPTCRSVHPAASLAVQLCSSERVRQADAGDIDERVRLRHLTFWAMAALRWDPCAILSEFVDDAQVWGSEPTGSASALAAPASARTSGAPHLEDHGAPDEVQPRERGVGFKAVDGEVAIAGSPPAYAM